MVYHIDLICRRSQNNSDLSRYFSDNIKIDDFYYYDGLAFQKNMKNYNKNSNN